MLYKGQVGEPLYTVGTDKRIQDGGEADCPDSFLKEYRFKLIKLYGTFYTKEAQAIARKRKAFTESFYKQLMSEITVGDLNGLLDLS